MCVEGMLFGAQLLGPSRESTRVFMSTFQSLSSVLCGLCLCAGKHGVCYSKKGSCRFHHSCVDVIPIFNLCFHGKAR